MPPRPRPRGAPPRRWQQAARRLLGAIVATGVLVVAGFLLWTLARGRPQDLPWTPLDLGDPVGAFTGRKLTALTHDFPRCEALMRRAGLQWEALPPRHEGPHCGYDDAVRLKARGSRRTAFSPTNLGIACPVAAATAMWEWNFVQPAARRHLGASVVAIEHFGAYNCRRMYGRDAGNWSQHATADAIDIAGFRLSDGRRVTVVGDWNGRDRAKRLFLREVRDGACDLFATTLSPDYNEAHRDHLHLDHADRGIAGHRPCR